MLSLFVFFCCQIKAVTDTIHRTAKISTTLTIVTEHSFATRSAICFITSRERYLTVKCQTPSKSQTDRRQKSNLVHFSLKMWQLVAIILMIFLTINWPNFVIKLVDPGFLSPLNFHEASRLVSPTGWTPPPSRHNGQSDASVRLLDGVWH